MVFLRATLPFQLGFGRVRSSWMSALRLAVILYRWLLRDKFVTTRRFSILVMLHWFYLHLFHVDGAAWRFPLLPSSCCILLNIRVAWFSWRTLIINEIRIRSQMAKFEFFLRLRDISGNFEWILAYLASLGLHQRIWWRLVVFLPVLFNHHVLVAVILFIFHQIVSKWQLDPLLARSDQVIHQAITSRDKHPMSPSSQVKSQSLLDDSQ